MYTVCANVGPLKERSIISLLAMNNIKTVGKILICSVAVSIDT
jgi:hypothetical protein